MPRREERKPDSIVLYAVGYILRMKLLIIVDYAITLAESTRLNYIAFVPSSWTVPDVCFFFLILLAFRGFAIRLLSSSSSRDFSLLHLLASKLAGPASLIVPLGPKAIVLTLVSINIKYTQ